MIERVAFNRTSYILFGTAWLAFAAPGTIAQSGATPYVAQSSAAAAARSQAADMDASPLTFEVATIKPAAPSVDGHTHINYPEGDRFSAINITFLALMQWAYAMPARQILDGPSWLGSSRFDIQATSSPDAAKPSGLITTQVIRRRMVRALLADRCALKLHTETRILPAYDLVVAKEGSKLQPTKSGGNTIRVSSSHFNGQGLNLTVIAEQLSQIAGRIVVDKTGLSGRYDVQLQWTPDDAPAADNSAPSLFTAIQEQLGLKLEPVKEAVPVLVIDHIEQPSAN